MVENPLLKSLRLPGDTVRLPSHALLYSNGEVADSVLKEGELHVYPMTTYEELLMKTPDLLFSGQAIVQTFSRCIPDIYNPIDLLSRDVDYLLVALRKATYGSTIDVNYQHTCDNSKNHSYEIDIRQFLTKSKEAANLSELTSVHVLANGQRATIRPFLLRDVITASQRAMGQPPIDEQSDLEFAQMVRTTVVEGLSPAISDVDGVTDPDFIKDWLDNLPAPWIRELSQAIDKLNTFGVEMTTTIQCKDCGEEIKISVPLNPQSFFTQPSEPVTVN